MESISDLYYVIKINNKTKTISYEQFHKSNFR